MPLQAIAGMAMQQFLKQRAMQMAAMGAGALVGRNTVAKSVQFPGGSTIDSPTQTQHRPEDSITSQPQLQGTLEDVFSTFPSGQDFSSFNREELPLEQAKPIYQIDFPLDQLFTEPVIRQEGRASFKRRSPGFYDVVVDGKKKLEISKQEDLGIWNVSGTDTEGNRIGMSFDSLKEAKEFVVDEPFDIIRDIE